MCRPFTELSEELRSDWPDDARRVHDSVSREFAMEVAARRALGASVLRARRHAGLTQVQLAAVASIQQAEISRIERGLANPTVST
jgi:ribosome-binding protein aMBF1 (putative translation factor)